jgi:hypothetical protein
METFMSHSNGDEMHRARIHEIADRIVERDGEILDRLAESEREETVVEGTQQAMLMRTAAERERCPICQGVDPDTLFQIPGTDPDDDFFEEDEPLDMVLAEWEANKHNVHLTKAPEEGRQADG